VAVSRDRRTRTLPGPVSTSTPSYCGKAYAAAPGAAFPAAARDPGHCGGDGRVPRLGTSARKLSSEVTVLLVVASSQLARCGSCLGSLRQLGPPRTSASSTGPPHWQLPRVTRIRFYLLKVTRVYGPGP
jgi:hypothetical protein